MRLSALLALRLVVKPKKGSPGQEKGGVSNEAKDKKQIPYYESPLRLLMFKARVFVLRMALNCKTILTAKMERINANIHTT
jgi:hypothetical protein